MDVHPEDLLDAAHAGRLDAAARQRLEQHVAHCAACAAEVALIDDFDAELAAAPDDDALLDRLVAGAVGEAPPVTREAPRKAAGSGGGLPRRLFWLVAASLALGAFGGAAAAMVAMWPQRADEAPPVEEPVVLPTEPAEEPVARRRRATAPAVTEEPVVEEPVIEEPVVEPAEAEVVEPPVAPPEAEEAEPSIPQLSAEELLAMANQARRQREYPSAVRLYRRLQRTYPRSREAALSHVTLGRLLLDGMNDPNGALREFDRYLGQRRHRVLDEEARVGRALSLMRLGRRADERAAWRELLEHHPDTLQAERARTRL